MCSRDVIINSIETEGAAFIIKPVCCQNGPINCAVNVMPAFIIGIAVERERNY